MKYNLKSIMLRAWKNYRKTEVFFSECLHREWLSAKAEVVKEKRIERARSVAGINEETDTWSGWKQLGYEAIHGSKALFGTELIWGSKINLNAFRVEIKGKELKWLFDKIYMQ